MTSANFTELSGLELLRWARDRQGDDIPSIGRLLGMTHTDVEPGTVSMKLTTQPDFANPLGTVHGGLLRRFWTQ